MTVEAVPSNALWRTPRAVCAVVESFLGDFLDPCAPTDDPGWTGATWVYTEAEDGLSVPWYRPVYMNPPYSRGHINRWVKKFIDEGVHGDMPYGLALLPARPGSRWWNRLAIPQITVGFWNGRIQFVGADEGAKFPSALVFISQSPDRTWIDFYQHFRGFATVWKPL